MIIKSLLDTDLYTFTVCFLYLQKFSRSIVKYKFIDRNNTIYPKGFAELLQREVNKMVSLQLTNAEEAFMSEKCYYLPKWFYTFLKGYRFNPEEVTISQDNVGHLDISIKGYAWRTVFWEVPLLAIISELYHGINGNDQYVDYRTIRKNAQIKCEKLIKNGLTFSEFGTRRRFSYNVQDAVIRTFVDTQEKMLNDLECVGNFAGTSNVYFAMKYNLTPIGTMSHQFISMCGALFGYQEANYIAMDTWQEVFNSDLGIFLYDTYGWESFQKNFSKKHAMLFTGLRVDSGDNYKAADNIIDKYTSLNIDSKTKQVTFSNGLSTDDAIEIHKYVSRRVKDNYGIGTHFTCDIENVKPMTIVIKLDEAQLTENTEIRKCIKLSDDYGKNTGDIEEIENCKKTLKIK